ncbi:hypothetical protein P154DRAFT_411222, partial [Amniculicola lignicola CBS 123094]
YKAIGSKIFKGLNAIYTLKEILRDILSNSPLLIIYLLVNILDKYISSLSKLLYII